METPGPKAPLDPTGGAPCDYAALHEYLEQRLLQLEEAGRRQAEAGRRQADQHMASILAALRVAIPPADAHERPSRPPTPTSPQERVAATSPTSEATDDVAKEVHNDGLHRLHRQLRREDLRASAQDQHQGHDSDGPPQQLHYEDLHASVQDNVLQDGSSRRLSRCSSGDTCGSSADELSRGTSSMSISRTSPKRTNLERSTPSWVNEGRSFTPSFTTQGLSWRKNTWVASILSYIPATEVVIEWCEWLANVKEPINRTGRLHSFVRSWLFSCICQLVILFNTAFVFVDTNYQIENMQKRPMPISASLEVFFCVFYSVELSLRVYSHGIYFFIGGEAGWNWFDMVLVLVTLVDLLGSVSGNVGFARSFRILKVIKVLRVVRVLQFFGELRLMINCVLGSLVSLFWCIVMICFVMFLFAVYFTQAVTQHMKDVGPSDVHLDDFPKIKLFFANVQTTILTLFMIVTGGEDWRTVYDALSQIGGVAVAFLLAYVFLFLFSIWNVVMSIFVEKVFKLAQPDTNARILETRRKQAEDATQLRELFRKADLDWSSTLSQAEFEEFIGKPEFQEFLQLRGIDIKEARTFFNMIADTIGDKEVDVNSVVRCCLGIKGLATSIDLHILRYEVRVVVGLLDDLYGMLDPDSLRTPHGVRRPSPLDDE